LWVIVLHDKLDNRPKNHKHILCLLLLSCCLAGLFCESPFSTREPETPDQESPSTFLNPSLADFVFKNLQFAFADRNVENYIRSFVDSTRSQKRFFFIPDAGVAASQPAVFTHWLIQEERAYLTQLLQTLPPDSSLSLLFFDQQIQSETSDEAVYLQDYVIIARHTRQQENIAIEFRGQSKFWLEKNATGTWAIYRWEDFANRSDPSWSQLKASLR
jgi:hypothetical protein